MPSSPHRRVLVCCLLVPLAAGCAGSGFDPFGPQPLAGAAQSAVKGRGNVFVTLDEDGVATVSGWVADLLSERAVLATVAARPEVRAVVDRLRVADWDR